MLTIKPYLTGILIILLHCTTLVAQNNRDHFLRLYMDNDALVPSNSASDWGYTSGTRVDYFFQDETKRNFLHWANRKFMDSSIDTKSWGLMQMIIAPKKTSLLIPDKLDYPYSGALLGSYSIHSADSAKRINAQSEWTIGVMGPPSFASNTHRFFHRLIKDPEPKGWEHQLPTDLLINYSFQVEKLLFDRLRVVSFSGLAKLSAGTMKDDLAAGLKILAGSPKRYYSRLVLRTFNDQPALMGSLDVFVEYNFYNALLEGGLFNKRSPIHDPNSLSGTDCRQRRLTANFDLCLLFALKKFSFSFSQRYRTAELQGFEQHVIGNLTLFIKL